MLGECRASKHVLDGIPFTRQQGAVVVMVVASPPLLWPRPSRHQRFARGVRRFQMPGVAVVDLVSGPPPLWLPSVGRVPSSAKRDSQHACARAGQKQVRW